MGGSTGGLSKEISALYMICLYFHPYAYRLLIVYVTGVPNIWLSQIERNILVYLVGILIHVSLFQADPKE